MNDQNTTAIVHRCCGCSCWVCERSHRAGPHTDECARRFESEQGLSGSYEDLDQ